MIGCEELEILPDVNRNRKRTMISVTVNQEKTEARLSITSDPENPATVTADLLVAALKKDKVVAGISKKSLFAIRDRFNHDPDKPFTTLVARGQPKKPVSQHRYKFYFTTLNNVFPGKLRYP